jgi:hypothetical protein
MRLTNSTLRTSITNTAIRYSVKMSLGATIYHDLFHKDWFRRSQSDGGGDTNIKSVFALIFSKLGK